MKFDRKFPCSFIIHSFRILHFFPFFSLPLSLTHSISLFPPFLIFFFIISNKITRSADDNFTKIVGTHVATRSTFCNETREPMGERRILFRSKDLSFCIRESARRLVPLSRDIFRSSNRENSGALHTSKKSFHLRYAASGL